jgi:ADP-ribosylglycohydrolase
MAIYLARKQRTFKDIKHYISDAFSYDLNFKIDDIRNDFLFDETCQGTVPVDLNCVLESTGFEDAIRNANF